MAVHHDFTLDDHIYVGETKAFEFEVFASDGVTPLDVSGYALGLSVRTLDGRQLIWKTTAVDPGGIVVSGVFNVDPALNAQLVTATSMIPAVPADSYPYQLWRLDVGSETCLTDGVMPFQASRL